MKHVLSRLGRLRMDARLLPILWSVLGVVTFCGACGATEVRPARPADFELRLEATKDLYLLGEPVVGFITLGNVSGEAVLASHELALLIETTNVYLLGAQEAQAKERDGVWVCGGGRLPGRPQPKVIEPGSSARRMFYFLMRELPDRLLIENAGTYHVQAVNRFSENKPVIRVSVGTPRGSDAEAYEFLRRNHLLAGFEPDVYLSSCEKSEESERVRHLYGQFLEEYGDSSYAPYARLALARANVGVLCESPAIVDQTLQLLWELGRERDFVFRYHAMYLEAEIITAWKPEYMLTARMKYLAILREAPWIGYLLASMSRSEIEDTTTSLVISEANYHLREARKAAASAPKLGLPRTLARSSARVIAPCQLILFLAALWVRRRRSRTHRASPSATS